MNPLGPVWRCRVCEGVNRDGRTCTTCGATVPVGEPLLAAIRTIAPRRGRPAAPPPIPPNPTRHQLRTYPIPEEIHPVDSNSPLNFDNGFDIRPMPGGCMLSFGPHDTRY